MTMTESPIPPRPPDMKILKEAALECTVSEFFSFGWSDDVRARFNEVLHEMRGEKEVVITNWTRHAQHGYTRDLTFTSPNPSAIGPRMTHCHQTQRYCIYTGEMLIIDTSQVQPDAPYGDYFHVEARWEVSPAPSGGVSVWVGLRVPFSKSSILKSVIESKTIEESKKSVESVLDAMRGVLRERAAAAATVASAEMSAAETAGLKRGSGSGSGGEGDEVDVSKLNIPEGSKEVIWRMLFGGPSPTAAAADVANTLGRGSGESSTKATGLQWGSTADEHHGDYVSPRGNYRRDFSLQYALGGIFGGRTRWSLFGAGSIGVVPAVVLLLGALYITLQVATWVTGVMFLGAPGGPTEADLAFWQRRAALLGAELETLERRMAYVAAELAHAQGKLKEASCSGRLEGAGGRCPS